MKSITGTILTTMVLVAFSAISSNAEFQSSDNFFDDFDADELLQEMGEPDEADLVDAALLAAAAGAIKTGFTVDNHVVTLVGIHDPGEIQLLEIAKAGRTLALLLGPVQGRHEDGHQHGNHRNNHQQLNKSITLLSAFNLTTFVGELRTVDRATGATTLVGVLGADAPGDAEVHWLGIAAVGTDEDFYSVAAEVGDELHIRTFTPAAPAGTAIININASVYAVFISLVPCSLKSEGSCT